MGPYGNDTAPKRPSPPPRFEPETPGTDEQCPLVTASAITATSSPPGNDESVGLLDR